MSLVALKKYQELLKKYEKLLETLDNLPRHGVTRELQGNPIDEAISPVEGSFLSWNQSAGNFVLLQIITDVQHGSKTSIPNAHHTKTLASELNLADLNEKNHSSLTNVLSSQHHFKTISDEILIQFAFDVDRSAIGDGKVLVFRSGSSKHEYEDQAGGLVTHNRTFHESPTLPTNDAHVVNASAHHRPWNLFDDPSWKRTLYLPLGLFTKVGVALLSPNGWKPNWVSHPRQLYNESEGKYWVYFAGGNTYRSIGLAKGTSLKSALTEITDGIGGTSRVLDKSGSGFEATGVSFPSVIYDPLDVASKRYKMLYNGRNGSGTYEKIGYAFSADGKSWTKEATNPVFEIASRRVDSPALLRLGNKFYMFYRQTLVDPQQVGLAYSDDCITWTQYAGNPVLELGAGGEWDDYVVSYISLYFDQGTFYMCYSGMKSGGLYKMGFAISSNCFDWTKLPYNPILEDSVSVSTGCLLRMENEFILLYEHDNPKTIRSATIP